MPLSLGTTRFKIKIRILSAHTDWYKTNASACIFFFLVQTTFVMGRVDEWIDGLWVGRCIHVPSHLVFLVSYEWGKFNCIWLKDCIRQSASMKNQCLADNHSLFCFLLSEVIVYLHKWHMHILKIQQATDKVKFFFVLLPKSCSLTMDFRICF